MQIQKTSRKINTLNEKPLHEALKRWYVQSGDKVETPVDGFVVDIVRGDLLIEIQTRNFKAIKRKLEKLIPDHSIRLVYPVAAEKWIVKLADDGITPISRRKSPKQGVYEHLFNELVSLPELLLKPNFSIELLLVQEEEVRRHDGNRGWRRGGWVTQERRLLKVVDQRIFKAPADMAALIPSALAEPFSTADLAGSMAVSRRLAQRMVYCLRAMCSIVPVGKQANSILYARLR
jgi:hypothetical protein